MTLAEEKKVVANTDGDTAEIDLGSKEAVGGEAPVEEKSVDLIAQLRAELKDKDDRFMRLRAEFDNYRKRTTKEKTELAATVEQSFLKDLLPLLDNLSRASKAAETADETVDVETLRKGIEMIKSDAMAAMGKHGLEPIETEGKMFDPNFHQAVGRIADPDKEDGMIAAEFQRGYTARGRVIRPSMVQVVSND
ncbi:MAG: nucleotide exchange factor GrpE [Selenomonadaceae bacterium]|nr:nucleotide exchange factor GrpE [Selenomonadaceae bacterium]